MNSLRFQEKVTSFFLNKRWCLCRCQSCGEHFLAKNPANKCCRYVCTGRVGELVQHKKPRLWVANAITRYFEDKGYIRKSFPNVNNPAGDTTFISAAVQIYNDMLLGTKPLCQRSVLSLQPCVRLKKHPHISNGFLRSFVNVATLKLGATPDMFCLFVDDWIGFLSRIGIHATNLNLVFCSEHINICGMYQGWGIDLAFDGLELGRCNYYDKVLYKSRRLIQGIDCGFCVERLKWVVEGGEFTGAICPTDMPVKAQTQYAETEDILRTIVLVIMSGIIPGARGERFQLKRLFESYLCNPSALALLDGNASYYYDTWRPFLRVAVSRNRCIEMIHNIVRKYWLKFIDESKL